MIFFLQNLRKIYTIIHFRHSFQLEIMNDNYRNRHFFLNCASISFANFVIAFDATHKFILRSVLFDFNILCEKYENVEIKADLFTMLGVLYIVFLKRKTNKVTPCVY